ncbi:HEPN domain-containing protein [Kocuria sp.]|uniref:HEPN domain-containing protein n=1 Tax=Kocuria sp. TaxID=1871328 RepID=UPI003453FA27
MANGSWTQTSPRWSCRWRGLHRKLHSGKTGALTKAQEKKARRAIGDIIARAKDEGEIDDLIAPALKNRVLNSQLGEPTLDQRVQDILDDVQPLVPIICGTAAGAHGLWKREVKSLRNNYAHGLEKQTQLRKNLVLSTSPTVLVASRCLVYVGCSPEKLVESIPLTEGGGNLVHWGRTLMPDFYAPNDTRDDQHTTAKGDPAQGQR